MCSICHCRRSPKSATLQRTATLCSVPRVSSPCPMSVTIAPLRCVAVLSSRDVMLNCRSDRSACSAAPGTGDSSGLELQAMNPAVATKIEKASSAGIASRPSTIPMVDENARLIQPGDPSRDSGCGATKTSCCGAGGGGAGGGNSSPRTWTKGGYFTPPPQCGQRAFCPAVESSASTMPRQCGQRKAVVITSH